jgi:hypothetical protein
VASRHSPCCAEWSRSTAPGWPWWIPRHPAYTTLADADLRESTRTFLAGPTHARELELAGTTCAKPPQSPSDLPFPAEDLQSWAECLIPGGYHEGLAVALCAPGGRHIGFLAPTRTHAAVRAERAGLYVPPRAEEGQPR